MMDRFGVIVASCFFISQLVSSKIYQCSENSFNATESNVWHCCKGQLFNMSEKFCTKNGPSSCANSENVKWCDNGHCIWKDWKCDRSNDCRDGSDEFGCSPCKQNEFRCTNDRCVSKDAVCNSVNDCGDGSDESGCPKFGNSGACTHNQFRCSSDHSCVDVSLVCDTKKDCNDCSDEHNCLKDRVIAKRHGNQRVIQTECGTYSLEEYSKSGAGTSNHRPRNMFQLMLIWLLCAIISGL